MPGTDRSSHRERFRAALPGAERWLTGARPRSPEDRLRALADAASALASSGEWDRYGEHGPVAELEERLCDLFGTPAAAMFPSGIMAQQAMLRVWCENQRCRRVALPGLSHLLHHEEDGPRLLHGFEFSLLGSGREVPTLADLAALPGPLGAVLLELPLRDAGYLLPTWPELVAFAAACRVRDVPLHLDGARIWEAQPHLGRSLAEIADLADSMYVSFYKGLGGLAGAALVGPAGEIARARTWRTRMGGTIFSLLPYAVAGLHGLDTQLPRMGEYHDLAVSLAAGLTSRGFRVRPDPPQSNAFQIHLDRPADEINDRLVSALEHERLALTPLWSPGDVPGWSWTELSVGSATADWDPDEAVAVIDRVVRG